MATITGTSGNDSLTGTSNDDTLNGLAGNDTLNGGAGGGDVYDGGTGFDTLDLRNYSSMNLDFRFGTIGSTRSGTFANIERVLASNGNDRLTGAAGDQNLSGRAGDDTLAGAAGADTLWGGAGADEFVFRETGSADADVFGDFSSGSDTIVLDSTVMSALGAAGSFSPADGRFWADAGASSGHDADDRIIYNTTTRQIFYDADGNGAGAAQLIATLQSGATLVATDIEVIKETSEEHIVGTDGDDRLVGTEGDDVLEGLGGNDTIDGRGGDDTLDGGDGDDTLDGEVGIDLVRGGSGNDTLHNHFNFDPGTDTLDGGFGNDLYDLRADPFEDHNTVIVDAGGVDSVLSHHDFVMPEGIENLTLFEGAVGTGNALDNIIITKQNEPESYFIDGAQGNDTLIGGLDLDVMRGGPGNDVFVFAQLPEDWSDRLEDFVSGTDVLQFDNSAFTGLGGAGQFATGDERFFAGPGATSGHDASDRVIYNTSNGELHYDADGSGSGAALDIATLQGAPMLAATDIVVTGEGGQAPIQGTAGNDSLTGTAGDDVLEGLAGNDTLTGLAGDDTIHGGTGNDAVVMGANYGNDVIDGGADTDKLDFGADVASNLTINLAAGTISGGGEGGAGSATVSNVERIIAGAFNDHVSGNAGGNEINGRRGNDTLSGAGGNDTLSGGAGQDSFAFAEAPSAGNVDRITDFVSGTDGLELDSGVFTAIGAAGKFSSGDARFWAAPGATSGHDATDRIVYNTSTGNLYYDADGSGSGAAQLIATLQGAPGLVAADIAVTAPAPTPTQGTDGDDRLEGSEGNDTIDALAGNDTLLGLAGDDVLMGSSGDDSLIGNLGHDLMEGGGGNDTLQAGWDNDTLDGGDGLDTLWLRDADSNVAVDLAAGTMIGGDATGTAAAALSNIEFINAGDMTHAVHISGSSGAELFRGGSSTDRILGGAGDDTIYGSNFAQNANGDELYGGLGNDQVAAFGGHGLLDGGAGNDLLAGGAGIDDFVFSVAPVESNRDSVAFFSPGTDKLVLNSAAHPQIGASGSFSVSDDRFASFVGFGEVNGFDAEDRVLYNLDTGELWYDADGVGAGAAQRIAILERAPALTATDFAVDEVTAPAAGQVINGSAGNDSLEGDAGDDTLVGMGGDDTLAGAGGNDSIDGGNGIDSLIGGSGNDTLTGGTFLDRFVFNEAPTTANADITTDFIAPSQVIGAPTPDELVFDGSVFTRIGSTSFVSGDARLFAGPNATSGQDASDRLVYDTSSGQLFYDADGSGPGASLLVATLQGAPALDARQIEVINGQPDDSGGPVIQGTPGNDSLRGTANNDTMDGLAGNDTIDGAAGDDSVIGGEGHDHLIGGEGVDTLDGGFGNDLYETTSADVLIDAGGADTISVFGSWTLGPGFENLIFVGDFGFGNELDNVIETQLFISVIDGRGGNDTLHGADAGLTTFRFSNGSDESYGDDVVHGLAGLDALDFSFDARSAVVVDLGAGTARGGGTGGAGTVTFTNVEYAAGTQFDDQITAGPPGEGGPGTGNPNSSLRGLDGDDTLIASSGWDRLVGGEGNDSIVGGAGDDELAGDVGSPDADIFNPIGNGSDYLAGGEGNDHLWGGKGADTLDGGLGNDVYQMVDLTDTLTDSGGVDTIWTEIDWSLGAGFENLTMFGTDALDMQGNDLSNFVRGNAGNNLFNTLAGDDTILAEAGDDIILMASGGAPSYGNDMIDGGHGSDKVEFGPDVASDLVVDLAAGTISGGGEGGAGSATLVNVERVIAGAFNDLVIGDSAANYIDGRRGDDTISGRAGNDTLLGRDGADRLEGGTGDDTLTGGAGNDSFVFADAPAAANVDRVTDFVSADQLLLDNAALTAIGGAGNFGSSDARFWAAPGATSGHDATDRIVYDTSTGSLYYDADGSGSGEAQLVATFQGNPTIAAADVTVI